MHFQNGLLLLAVLTLSHFLEIAPCAAETKTFIADATYAMGDGETPAYAEAMALQQAKQNALEQAGTYIESYTKVRNYDLMVGELRSVAGGILQSEVLDKGRRLIGNSLQFHVKIKAAIALDSVDQLIERLRNRTSLSDLAQGQGHLTQTAQEQGIRSRSYAEWKSLTEGSGAFFEELFFGFFSGVHKVHGPVKMVTARLDDRETPREHETWRSLHFDRNGNLAEEKHYDGDRDAGGVPSVIVRYDDHGYLSQIEERYFLGEDTYRRICGERNTHRCGTHKKVMSYDRQGHKTEELEFYRDDSVFSKWTALYDSQGNRTQETRYYDDGSEAIFLYVPSSDQESIRITMYRAERRNQFKLEFYGEIVQQFDQRGRLLSEDKRSGVFDYSRKYRYDQNGYSLGYEELKFAGDKLEQIWGSRDMETLFKTKRVYDSAGRETEHVSYTNGSATKTSYRFDENGHLIEMTDCDSSSRCRTTLAAKYDADGLPIETILNLPREGRIRITHSYEFDSYHNWTKHVQVFEPEAPDKSSKKHAITVERTIIYY